MALQTVEVDGWIVSPLSRDIGYFCIFETEKPELF
jgi:hypothetical protein